MKQKKFYQMMGRIIDSDLQDMAIAFLQNSKIFAETWTITISDSKATEKKERIRELLEKRKTKEQNEKSN